MTVEKPNCELKMSSAIRVEAVDKGAVLRGGVRSCTHYSLKIHCQMLFSPLSTYNKSQVYYFKFVSNSSIFPNL